MTVLTEALTIDISTLHLTEVQFYALCRSNEALRFELTAQGKLIVTSPVGGESGNREAGLNAKVWIWNEQTQLGKFLALRQFFNYPAVQNDRLMLPGLLRLVGSVSRLNNAKNFCRSPQILSLNFAQKQTT